LAQFHDPSQVCARNASGLLATGLMTATETVAERLALSPATRKNASRGGAI
jgi:hypothetical protein